VDCGKATSVVVFGQRLLDSQMVFHTDEGHTSGGIEPIGIEPGIEFQSNLSHSHGGLKSRMGIQNAPDRIRKGLEMLLGHTELLRID
jgi:hypothetical protein